MIALIPSGHETVSFVRLTSSKTLWTNVPTIAAKPPGRRS
jgi:hypothetical protein